MKKRNIYARSCLLLIVTVMAAVQSGCKKYLDAKPSKSLVVPSSVEDLQALLDDNSAMNNDNFILAESSADNYYITDNQWQALNIDYRNTYIWGDEIISASNFSNEWFVLYQQVNTANTVLDNLKNISRTAQNAKAWDNVEGSALFYRSFCFAMIAFNWAVAYDSTTAGTDPGIPLRLNSDFNEPSERASVAATYGQIINDLKTAAALLPAVPLHVLRPSKAAAYALLARIYLSMAQFKEAGIYTDSSLAINSSLLDYNTLRSAPGEYYSFPQFNKEVIFCYAGYSTLVDNYKARIDSGLYRSYDDNDLRKTLFFFANTDGSQAFKGNYTGSYGLFTGLATDELYLNKAECLARSGNTAAAQDILHQLLTTRWKTATYQPPAIAAQDVLPLILEERRKELLMRNIRWMDIKRLNVLKAGIDLERDIATQAYHLKAGSPDFALPIPVYVIEHSSMKQNEHL